MSRKQRRRARHDNKMAAGIAPGDLNGQVLSVEGGDLKVTPVEPSGPFAQKPPVNEPVDVGHMLKVTSGKLKPIGMGEEVDLAAMTRANGGQPPKFTVVKKSTIENFKAKLASAGIERMPRVEETTDRLMATLKAEGVDVVSTADPWLKQPGPDGKISIPVDHQVRRRIDKLKKPGETDEDVIKRVLDVKRQPTYPPGTEEHDLALDMVPVLVGGALDERKAEAVHAKIKDMPVGKRYAFLKSQLMDTLGPNDGTAGWSEKLGMLMSFVHHTLPDNLGQQLAQEVAEKLRPHPSDDHHLMDKVGREAAEKIEKTLENLPPDMAAKIVTELFEGKIMAEDGDATEKVMPGFTDHVTKHLARSGKGRATIQRLLNSDNVNVRWTPEQRAKLQRYLDTGDPSPALDVVRDKRKQLAEKRSELDREQARIDASKRHDQAMDDLIAMSKNPRLTRLGETGYHKAVQAWDDGSMIIPQMEPLGDLNDVLSRGATVFVVQHDWSAAFDKATDFAEGEVLLPYNDVVFEFRIGGRRVCCCLRGEEGHPIACLLLIETTVGWALAGLYQIHANTWSYYQDGDDIVAPVLNLCRQQIRAVCIALEAQVVETEVVRAPHRLNRKRERAGKIPMFDHHVVHLANRKRYLPREPLPGDLEEEHAGKRLHFVRGHYRHYTNSKTWIKWHLRGNPDLGFVDKEYRL